jgi:hypothetical protein
MKTNSSKTVKKGSNLILDKLIPELLKIWLPEFSPQKRNFIAPNLYKLLNNEKIYLKITDQKIVRHRVYKNHFLMVEALDKMGIPYISAWDGPVMISPRFLQLDEQKSRPLLRILKIVQIFEGDVSWISEPEEDKCSIEDQI